jgi:hypothetical protein
VKPAAEAIWWWELRRILYNLALLLIGVAAIFVFEVLMGEVIPPGEDAMEPLGLILAVGAYAIGANVCYTLGWITELFWSKGDTEKTKSFRQRTYWAGFIFSCALTTLPAWLGLFAWTLHRVAKR